MDDNNSQEPNVAEEPTIVVDATEVTNSTNQAELIVSLTNLINSNLTEIASLEKEMGQHKEMIDSVLENDTTYREHANAAKEATKVKSATKKEILKRPDVRHVVEKLNEVRENIKNTKEELSNYIQEYARVSGQNYFESEDGTVQEIIYVAKLRKKQA